MLQEGAHLPVALANHGNHAYVGEVVARHGAEQRAFAHAAAAEDADALAFAAGKQAIDAADAGYQWFVDVFAFERAGRSLVKIVGSLCLDRRAGIEWAAEAVEDAAEQPRAD